LLDKDQSGLITVDDLNEVGKSMGWTASEGMNYFIKQGLNSTGVCVWD